MILLQRLGLVWAIFKHKQTPWFVRLLLLAGLAYILLPFDLIPDHVLLMGWMDDAALAIVLVVVALRLTPEELLVNLVKKINKKDERE